MIKEIRFTRDAVIKAFEYLLDVIGEKWFEESLQSNRKGNQHPLLHWYEMFPTWKEQSMEQDSEATHPDIVNLALLGQSLELVQNDKKFLQLVERLKNRDDFYATAFEVEVAAAHKMRNLQVEFIEESPVRTPDLRVKDNHGDLFYIECKNRDLSSDKKSEDL